MISLEAIEKILDIKEKTRINSEEMASGLKITFYPIYSSADEHLLNFRKKLEDTFLDLEVEIIPYEAALVTIPIKKVFWRIVKITSNNLFCLTNKLFGNEPTLVWINFGVIKNTFIRRRIKQGISVVTVGENPIGFLPMERTSSFSECSIVSILPMPESISEESSFFEHFDTAMALFSYHMTNIVLAVGDKDWLLYNFNASHPRFPIDGNFRGAVLHALIPKIYAPIRPVKFEEFKLIKQPFNPHDSAHQEFTSDLLGAGNLLEDTKLYPPGKKIDDLPFRNSYYRWIGKIHLDHRNGMSYGFLARQLPVSNSGMVCSANEFERKTNFSIPKTKDFFKLDGRLYLLVELMGHKLVAEVPDVWVLSQRSGCNKTNMDPRRDLIKLGLVSGQLMIQGPGGLKINANYKTSFDTRVIVAHAVGNAIVGSILEYLRPGNEFSTRLASSGMSINHWHGYIAPGKLPAGYWAHGQNNPHVACSSPQSAIFALKGKLESFFESVEKDKEFLGDVHIEPHHGTNVNFPSLRDFALWIKENKEITSLGNKYLALYNKNNGPTVH